MTDLQRMYNEGRDSGLKHRATLRRISRETGLDEATVQRALARARREDERAAKKGRKR